MSFINFTNHPSDQWDSKQKKEAEKYGEIVDIPFPAVDPMGDEQYIERLGKELTDQIMKMNPKAVLCQGEFTLVYQVVQTLKKQGITVFAACSKRNVIEEKNKKIVTFDFVQFRQY